MLDPITRAGSMVRNLSRNKSKENLDRFIPYRSATKFDFVLEKGWKHDGDPDSSSPSKVAHRRRLKEVFNLQDSRILAYKSKPPAPVEYYPKDDFVAVRPPKPVRRQRHIPQAAGRVLDAPDLSDDYYVNLLDWSSKNLLAIALRNTVHVWNPNNDSASELVEIDDDTGPVTSVRWAPDGNRIAVGFQNSQVQLLDSTTSKVLRVLSGHQNRVGSLAWNEHVLTTGSMDNSLINTDMRVKDHIVEIYQGHRGQVCGLNWSSTGQQLASGGNDNLVYIWDRSMASTRGAQTQFLHCFEDHKAAVRAVAWCPFQRNLLASGGGAADGCIRFWNSQTGTCLNSVDTASPVCSLLWSNTDRELLSSHDHQLTLWKYPSMVKMADLAGHESRVLYTAQGPSGLVASAAGGVDETLRIWKIFGDPKAAKPAKREAQMHFAHCRSRIR